MPPSARLRSSLRARRLELGGIGAVKVSCDCGFMVGSHDEDEVSQMSIMHVKNKHGRTITQAEARKKMMPM